MRRLCRNTVRCAAVHVRSASMGSRSPDAHHHQTDIKTPCSCDPCALRFEWISRESTLLESLVVIRARDGGILLAKIDSSNLRAKEARTGMPHHRKDSKSANTREVQTNHSSINFRFTELYGEIQRRIEDYIEIISAVSELPEIFGVQAEFI